MTGLARNELTYLIITWVRDNRQLGNSADLEITEDTDLMSSGLLDSLGFVDLLLFVEGQSGIKIDLTDVDPEEFTIVKGLCNIVLSNASNDDQQTTDMSLADPQQFSG